VSLVLGTFGPDVAQEDAAAIAELVERGRSLAAAVHAKNSGAALAFPAVLGTIPMAHQVACMNFAMARFNAGARGAALLMEQGTGKSLAAIGVANGLRAQGAVEWALVVAPNSVRGVWGGAQGEILTHTGDGLLACIIMPRGTRAEKVAEAERRVDEAGSIGHDAFPWVIMNYEAFALNPRKDKAHRDMAAAWAALAQRRPGVLILDESTEVKNANAYRTRVLADLSPHFKFTMILTGTPVTSHPLDVFGQFETMERGALGFGSYLAFDREYALRARRQLKAGGHFEEVVGYQHLDDLENRVANLSYRARAADCLDLPPVVVKRIPVDLSAQQAAVLASLKKDAMAELGDGTTVDGRNILTRYLRMAQVIGGHVGVLDEDGRNVDEPVAFDPNPKLDALEEYLALLLDDPEQKAVIFAAFVPEVLGIVARGRERGWKPVPFHGAVKDDARQAGLDRFRQDPDTRLFVAQYQTGSKGLTLVEAATIIFYSPTFSLLNFDQARKRVHRKGQTKTVTEAHFLGQVVGKRGPQRTLDHVMLEALQAKKGFADLITGDHRAILGSL